MPRSQLERAADRIRSVAAAQALAHLPKPERFRVTVTDPLELEGLETDTLLDERDDDVEVHVHVKSFALQKGDIVWVQPEAGPNGEEIARWNVISVADSAGAAHVPNATDTVKGILRLSVPAASVDDPIAVGANDPRLGDARPPIGAAGGDLTGTYPSPSIAPSVVTNAHVSVTAGIAESKLSLASDAAAATPSRRTLGTGALQAAAGNDPRLSDARPPTGVAGGDLAGTYPNPQVKSSVGLTGSPTAVTAALGTNTTQLATTEFVQNRAATLATATAGIVLLADYPRLTGEADDTNRLARATTAANAAYPFGYELWFPYGTVTVASFPSLRGKTGIVWRGLGGHSSGGGMASSIVFTGTGPRGIDLRETVGARLIGLLVQYTSGSFTGTLVDFRGTPGSAGPVSAYGGIENCVIDSSGGVTSASELVALANGLGMTFDRVLLGGAVCAIRGLDTAADFCNGNMLRDVHTSGTTQAPIQDLSGEGNTIINPVGEPLTDGSAGWYKTNAALGGSRGLTVEGGWWGDATAAGSWVDYTGVGLSMRGGAMHAGGTQIKLGASTSAVSITGLVLGGHSSGTTTAFQIGTGCDHLTLWPNRIEGMGTVLAYATGAKTPPNSVLPDSNLNAVVRYGGGLAVSGEGVPTQGKAVEYGMTSGASPVGYIQSEDRDAGTSLPFHISGSEVGLYYGGTLRLRVDSTGIGFFDKAPTPVAKPGATTDLKAGLASLGLVTAGGASPLNLEGGTLTAATVAATTLSGTPNFSGAATGQTAAAADNSAKLATTAYADAAVGAQTPWYHSVNVFMPPALNTNWSAPNAFGTSGATTTFFMGGERMSSGVQNAEIGWDLVLGAGTWKFQLIHETAGNRGIYTLRIDGVDAATIDGYSASGAANVISESGTFSVATSGKKRVTIKMATKNASSAGYYGALQAVTLVRTA